MNHTQAPIPISRNMKKCTVLLLSLLSFSLTLWAQEKKQVFVMEIKSEIDARTTRYVDLALKEAKDQKADFIIIEMDTYGGVLTDANEIRTQIMDVQVPIWVFINKDAASAGALISIACDSIYMAAGANIGAATVVTQDGQAAPDKYQSYMRSIMRSTAQTNGRDPKIAEGMVDEDIEIEGVSPKGEVITFSTEEAIKNGFCEAEVSSIEAILKRNKVENYTITTFELPSSEKIISFFINPFISGILILIIIGGIYFELQTPGVGFPLAASVIALILYLTPYYLNGLAANWEIIVLCIGFILIAAEVFVIPGFGVAGVSGISLVVLSLVLIMINNDALDFTLVPLENIMYAMAATFGGILGFIAVVVFGGYKISQSVAFQRFALPDTMSHEAGYTANFKNVSLIGKKGIAQTTLRPSGKVLIDGEQYDAYSRGEFIEANQEIVVVEESANFLKVKSL
ncbi:NfeD family protein [Cytophagales bacterium LB-30]|uniref:NfeD family protein n=1 Tax=Shiella aurantiaca TaxID=3058365 RepID=A0ABT8F1N4_9BACT|nr:NfeD family protein [Shiella aurantiaca]MDN4164208.1 NfeD family protein [Shiella aurantiaca]